ncbi:hypothetical protein O0L34_g14510 [Tuta absoluta]|nr:hypothetical protein O0L34_g14510 [Tuta absoluta]
MDLFKSFLDSMPKNRSEMVNHLDLPDDVLKNRTYVGEDLSSLGSVTSSVCTLDDLKPRPKSPLSTDSSISLSRALTASEIDYEMFRRYKTRRRSEPFRELDEAIRAFPDEYLVAANSFQSTKPEQKSPPARDRRPLRNENLIRRMECYFDDECRVFGPDDPGLLDLMDAIDAIDLKTLDTDLL